jgi:hypothetical protein
MIRDVDILPILDSGVKKAPGPGSRIRIGNIDSSYKKKIKRKGLKECYGSRNDLLCFPE